MRNFGLVAIFLTFLHFCASAPVLVTTDTTSVATIVPSIAATATPAAASAAALSETSSTGSSVLDALGKIYSALTSGSSSSSNSDSTSSSSSSSSGSSWRSVLSLFLDKLSGDDDASTSSTTAVTPAATSTTALSTLTGLFTGLLKTSSLSSTFSPNTVSTTTTSSTSSSTAGIYDAIYNSSEDIDEQFAKDILDAHNEKRALHGVGALSWASGPYKYAKNNADSYDCSGVLTHTHGQYGENLAAGFSTGVSAVEAWYVEGDSYDYTTHNEYNHFTQLVWKGSTQVGCAYKDCSAEGWKKYIVCEYNPVGNVIGQEEENVLPLVSSS